MNLTNQSLRVIALLLVTFCFILEVESDFSDNKVKSGNDKNVPEIFDYGKYVDKFNKRYSLVETLNKAKLFFGRTLKIFKHNILFRRQQVKYYLAQNEFTDMTAAELRDKYLRYDYSDIKPVAEADDYPDEPADSSLISGDDEVGESRSSVQDDSKEKVGRSKEVAPALNFLDEDRIEDVKVMLRELKERPELANKIALLMDLKDETSIEAAKKIEEARIKNNIEFRPFVDSNNENYDPDTISSYGLFNLWSPDMTTENYGKYLLDDQYDSDLKIGIYPTPTIPKEKVLNLPEMEAHENGFMNSLKGFFDFFSADDWYESDDELDEYHLFEPKVDEHDPKQEPVIIKKEKGLSNEKVIKYDIDWRQSGCISKPKSQMSCNSCYAFTALSLMEFFHCRQTKKLTDFSAQYIVDCGPKLGHLGGCRGGKISSVGQFITEYGIELNTLYPYVGSERQCPYNEEDEEKKKNGYLRPKITHWQNFPEMEAWSKWLPKSPIIVGINMPSDFLAYGGGVHDGSDCMPGMVHALLLVGSGKQNGKAFWLLKNSYSENWGESGYLRLSKSAPYRCFNTATVVRAKFTD